MEVKAGGMGVQCEHSDQHVTTSVLVDIILAFTTTDEMRSELEAHHGDVGEPRNRFLYYATCPYRTWYLSNPYAMLDGNILNAVNADSLNAGTCMS